jgi:serine/threonine protein kinase
MKEMNILLDEKANVKICDFGLAHQFTGDNDTWDKKCGTAGYMAPEQIEKKAYRMMPDWWALGIILYKLMMRRSPFEPEGEWVVDTAWTKDKGTPGY